MKPSVTATAVDFHVAYEANETSARWGGSVFFLGKTRGFVGFGMVWDGLGFVTLLGLGFGFGFGGGVAVLV